VRRALPIKPAVVEDAARFSTGPFTPAGIAYDGISRRFLFGDVTGRRLFVVGEGSDRTVDLVRADSAGFDDVTAIAIDAKRGDLWVASTAADGTSGAVHRLQLISGRALTKFAVPVQGSMRLSDLAVAGDGTVFILDSGAPRVLALQPGASVVEPLMRLTTPNPVSMAVDDSGQRAYVAHGDGIVRVDLQARRASPLTAGNGIALTDFDYIRLHRDSLVGSQMQPDGSRGIVRLQLNADRRTVSAATLIEASSSEDGMGMAATISGDDLFYLTDAGPQGAGSAGPTNVRVKRLQLR
jgi:sugar lactone lactonase YvrE